MDIEREVTLLKNKLAEATKKNAALEARLSDQQITNETTNARLNKLETVTLGAPRG